MVLSLFNSVRVCHLMMLCRFGNIWLSDIYITDRIKLKEAHETATHGCPCEFLGEKNDGTFYTTPSCWKANNKCEALVWIAFCGVKIAYNKMPYRTCIELKQWLCGSGTSLHPLSAHVNNSLIFTIEFMDMFANNKIPGCSYAGIISFNAVGCVDIVRVLPNNGVDIQHVEVYWDLSSGHTFRMSLFKLSVLHFDAKLQLYDLNRVGMYIEVGRSIGFDILGVPETVDDEIAFHKYCINPTIGTIAERMWEDGIQWKFPDRDSCDSWWVINSMHTDKTSTPIFLCCSVVILQLDEVKWLVQIANNVRHDNKL